MRRVWLAAVVLGLVTAACGQAAETIAEQAIESQGGGDVDLDIDQDGETVGFDVENEDGSASVQFGEQDLPDDFPVPVPDGGEVLMTSTSDMGGQQGSQASLQYPADDYEDLVEFYAGVFDSHDDTQTFSMTGDAASTTYVSESAGWSVTIVSSSAGTQLTVTAQG